MTFIPYPAPTSGVGIPAMIAVDSQAVALSMTGTTTHQITATVKDLAGTIQTGVVLTLTAVANASGGTTVYTGTITGGASNAFAGYEFTIAGFTTGANNGTFMCAASSGTTLTLDNASGAAETHAATATADDVTPLKFVSSNPSVVTVSAAGVITAVRQGEAMVEVAFPFGNNTHGTANSGQPIEKLYTEITVTVRH